MRPETELLRECLEQPERIGSVAENAFTDMLERLDAGMPIRFFPTTIGFPDT